MITRLIVRNFKRFDDAVIPLGAPVVFVGPNNSGKTTALQALALWELGLRTWMEKRGKVSDEYLPAVFGSFFKQLGLPNSMNKSDYGQLARLLEPGEVDPELIRVLDEIARTAPEQS